MSQYQKILKVMLSNPAQEWWLPQDFMRSNLGECFVGYEASARLSELRNKYPSLFFGEKQGRFFATKLNFKVVDDILLQYGLPEEFKSIISPKLF